MPSYSLPYWLRPGDDRPDNEIEDEVREELQLHVDLLTEEHRRRGEPVDEARRTAAEAFGDFESTVRRCRQEKQGYLPMLKRLQAALIALLVLATAFIGWQQSQMHAMVSINQKEISETLELLRSELERFPIAVQESPSIGAANPDAVSARVAQAKLDLVMHRLQLKEQHLHRCEQKRDRLEQSLPHTPTTTRLAEIELKSALANRDEANQQFSDVRKIYDFKVALAEQGEASDTEVAEAKIKMNSAEHALINAGLAVDAAETGVAKAREIDKLAAEALNQKLANAAAEVEQAQLDLVEARVAVIQAEEVLRSATRELPTSGDLGVAPDAARNTARLAADEITLVAQQRAPRGDLSGVVIDASGDPIADADVLLIIKTWPNNRYRQDDIALTTDADGRFNLPRAVPLDGQYGVNAAVVAPGHAIASQYVLVENPAGEEPETIDFKLVPSTTVKLKLTNTAGEPLPRTFVAPSSRNDADNQDHRVYFQGSKPAWRRTDGDGAVEIDWFAAGDYGKVTLKPRGGDWQEHEFETPSAPDETVTIVCDTGGR